MLSTDSFTLGIHILPPLKGQSWYLGNGYDLHVSLLVQYISMLLTYLFSLGLPIFLLSKKGKARIWTQL